MASSGLKRSAPPSPRRENVIVVIFVIVALLSAIALAAPNSRRQTMSETSKKIASSGSTKEVAASGRQTTPVLRIPYVVDKIYNPILMYASVFSFLYYLMPGLAAFVVGFAWPFYEYLRNGYTFYQPGIIWDKDFTEYFHWYFKHKIYKKKYWNLDAYLFNFYDSHNENLKAFYTVEEHRPEKDSAETAEKPQAEDGKDRLGEGVVEGAGNAASNATKDPGFMEEVLSNVLQDMVENNPHLRDFIQDLTGPEGYERIKATVQQVMEEEFTPTKRIGSGLPVYTGFANKTKSTSGTGSNSNGSVVKSGEESVQQRIPAQPTRRRSAS